MKLDALVRAHGFMKTERPPELWEADTEDVSLIPLLGEMIAAALAGGSSLEELTLNVSNVKVMEPEASCGDEGRGPCQGEYVAVTVRGMSDLGPDETWRPGDRERAGLLGRLGARLAAARARYAYVRRIPPAGSVTAFFSRAE